MSLGVLVKRNAHPFADSWSHRLQNLSPAMPGKLKCCQNLVAKCLFLLIAQHLLMHDSTHCQSALALKCNQ